jgi:hypothetical protein
LAKDAFVGDAACDLHSCVDGDLMEDLVEAGVVGGDGDQAVGVGDFGVFWRELRWSQWY